MAIKLHKCLKGYNATSDRSKPWNQLKRWTWTQPSSKISTCSTIYQQPLPEVGAFPEVQQQVQPDYDAVNLFSDEEKFVRAATKAWKLCISDDACLLIRKPPPHLPEVSRGRLRCRLGYDCCLVLGELIFIRWPWGQTLPLFGEGARRKARANRRQLLFSQGPFMMQHV